MAITDYNAVKAFRQLLFITWLAAFAAAATAQTSVGSARLVNEPLQSSTTPSGGSAAPTFSADGRYLAFVSYAKDIVPGQTNSPYCDVFVRDLATSTTRLVSANKNGVSAGNGNSSMPQLSSNGQYCAFLSAATDLVPGVTNAMPNIYVRDLVSGVTTIEVKGFNGSVSTNGYCTDFQMTPDGHYIVFASTHTDLTTNIYSPATHIFVRDHFAGTTELITVRAANPFYSSATASDLPCISDDGRRVLFHSSASDLGGSPGAIEEVYLCDRVTHSTLCIGSNAFQFYQTTRPTYGGTLSADGLTAVFVSHGYKNVFLYDVSSSNTTMLPYSADFGPATDISADGHRIIYKVETGVPFGTVPTPASYTPSIYVWDTLLQTNFVVDGNQTNINPGSVSQTLSRDGTKVAFINDATNYSGGQYYWQLLVRDLDSGVTHLVTTRTNDQPLGAGALVCSPTFSPDGKFLAFVCDDDGLVPDDHNHAADIFLWSADTGQLQLITTHDNSRIVANDISGTIPGSAVISTNGRYVAFAAVDGNLVAGDTNGFIDIFVRDVSSGQTVLASTDTATGSAAAPQISGDGRYVVYLRGNGITNLTVGDVYLRDLQTGSVTVLNTNLIGVPSADAAAPALSPDGRFVAFHTRSALISGDTNAQNDVYLYDIQNATLSLISAPPPGYSSAYQSSNAVFSPDSQWVVFQSRSPYLVTPSLSSTSVQLYAYNLNSSSTHHVSYYTLLGSSPLPGDSGVPVFSADGHYCVFPSSNGVPVVCVHPLAAGVSNSTFGGNIFSPSIDASATRLAFVFTNIGTNPSFPTNQIAVMTLATQKTNVVSIGTNAPALGNGHCAAPIITPDGRFVIFTSKAPNLVANDTNGYTDIFIRDLVLSNTIAISRVGVGTPQYGAVNPVLGADGRTILFQSFATDLASDTLTATRNLFIARINAGDSDHDGMDDDWEMTYFGNLSHDGTADTDGDGMTDLQEFRAGTNPINNTSVLRCLTVTLSIGGGTVYWSSVPGQNYQVQVKEDLNSQTWGLFSAITATNEVSSIVDPNANIGTQRFYRVVTVSAPPPPVP